LFFYDWLGILPVYVLFPIRMTYEPKFIFCKLLGKSFLSPRI
jgi:hypothetical protein